MSELFSLHVCTSYFKTVLVFTKAEYCVLAGPVQIAQLLVPSLLLCLCLILLLVLNSYPVGVE